MEIKLKDTVALPAPRMDGGMPLMAALAARHSTREFSPREIPQQVLGDLLWAACGVNRLRTGGRTAPSARNWREIDIYAASAAGLHRYVPEAHRLQLVARTDLRAASGMQEFAGTAPLDLVYVADLARVDAADPVERRFYCAADAAFIAQNVYLFCASAGLACVVRGALNRSGLAQAMHLGKRQRVILAHTVGYAAD
ncbi:MAG: nitroreductase family protein [Nevskia sp.]|nr:nitroreductase family protein [Nevskia sp.]